MAIDLDSTLLCEKVSSMVYSILASFPRASRYDPYLMFRVRPKTFFTWPECVPVHLELPRVHHETRGGELAELLGYITIIYFIILAYTYFYKFECTNILY